MLKTAIKFTPVSADERAKIDFKAGDTVRVWSKIPEEKGKFRLQAFEGLILSRKHGKKTTDAMFTVRKISNSVGVERIFPLYSPMIDKIEVVKRSKARRAKLYYIRDKAAKEIRKKMKSTTVTEEMTEAPETETTKE